MIPDAENTKRHESTIPTAARGWWYTLPDGTAAGPFKRREIATRWRRYRIVRRTPPQGLYVPRRLAWHHAGIDPFVGGTR